MKVYLASRFTNRNFVKAFASKVLTMRCTARDPHIEFVQTWTEEPVLTVMESGLQKELAYRDLHDLDEADAIFILTEGCELVPGGMHFEAGYAYASGKRIVVIGPRVNVFYHLGDVEWYPSVQAFLESNFESAFNE